ncbi:MAG TPA: LCP family protein [Dermatophilaceae bacterium]|nr:LCP family protein [Dermatophilaceae bacterium]
MTPVRSTPTRAGRADATKDRARRFYGLTALSTILPGAGLIGTRRRVLGITLVTLAVASLVAVLVWLSGRGLSEGVLDVAVRSDLLGWLVAVLAVGAVVWCGAIVLTATTAGPGREAPGLRLRQGFVVLCCVAVLAPSAFAARYLSIQRGVLDVVFVAGGDATGRAIAGGRREDPWADTPRVNVLLLGSDAGSDRVGVRTDSMMVASINTRTGDTVLFGVPRNLENAPFPSSNPLSRQWPDGYDCGDGCLLNGVWTLATDNKALFPDDPNPGLTTTRDVIGEVLGLDIQRTVVIDLKGFESLVDAMGGVDINVRERVPIGGKVVGGQVVGINGWIETGPQHLDGKHALWYARSRATTDDFSRMRRQRCVAGALIEQADPARLLRNYPALAQVVKDNVSVDIPQDELPAWVVLVNRIQSDGTIRSLPLTNKVISVTDPDFGEIHELVRDATSVSTPSPSGTSSPATPSAPGSTSTPGKPSPSRTGSSAPGSSSSTTTDDTLSDLTASC